MSFKYEAYDDSQNPRKGWDATLRVTPFLDVAPHHFFWNATLLQHILWPLTDSQRLVLSGWYNIGISPGVKLDKIPLNKRFYGGWDALASEGMVNKWPVHSTKMKTSRWAICPRIWHRAHLSCNGKTVGCRFPGCR